MTLPRNLTRTTFAVAGLAAVAYVAAALVLGWDDVGASLGRLGAGRFALVLLLSGVNYTLRFWRWHAFLAAVGTPIPLRRSLQVYFATYVMVITPGKIGEAFKAGMLRDHDGVPLSRGLPAVLAERVYDFLAVLVLVGVGAAFWRGPFEGAGVGLAVAGGVVGLLLLVRSRRVRAVLLERASRSRHLGEHRVALDDALAATDTLLAPVRGSGYLALSTAAWFCECAGMALVCARLAPEAGLLDAVFIYGTATLIGSVSFLPGGLGGTEAVLVLLLATLGVPRAAAGAVAFIVRLATLWLAVVVGVLVLGASRRSLLGPAERARGGGDG